MKKLKVEGTYITGKAGDGEYVDFLVEGEMGETPSEGWTLSLLKARYLQQWIEADKKKCPKRVNMFSNIDIISEKQSNMPDIIGVNILDMEWNQLQALVCRYPKQLLSSPLPKSCALRIAREKTAELYLEKVKGVPLKDISDIYKFDISKDLYYNDWKGKEIIVEDIIPKKEDEKDKKTLSDIMGDVKPSASGKSIDLGNAEVIT